MKNIPEVYLDNAAAALPETQVLDFYREKMQQFYANQEALHSLAYRSRSQLAAAEKELSQLFTGRPDHPVIWGGSATEIFHLLGNAPFFKSTILSELEHPALTANFCRGKRTALWHPGRDGLIRTADLDFTPDIASFHQVQSELGVMQDLDALFAALPPRCCRLVDAVQAAGKMPLYSGADIIVVSGVKFGAPGGAAALLNPRGNFTEKLLQYAEKLRRENYAVSRVNVPQALTMVYAAARAEAERETHFCRLRQLRDFIAGGCIRLGLKHTLPETTPVSPYILNMLLPEQESAVVVRALSAGGVHAAPGSACSAESREPGAALLAIGRSRSEAFRALRLSFSTATRQEDGEIFLAALAEVLKNY